MTNFQVFKETLFDIFYFDDLTREDTVIYLREDFHFSAVY